MTTTVPSSIINTDANELQNLLNLLPQTPIMIPLKPQDKRPDTPGSWKNPTCHLTPKQAIQHLQKGGNIGIVAHEWLCIIDLDNPKKYLFPKKTLTIKTRSGALHKYYINDGTIQNSVGVNSLAKCGEVRAEWQYVVSPGSYVPPPEGSTGEGLYRIVDYTPIVELSSKELPNDFLPNTTVKVIPQEHINPSITVRNKQGLSLQDIQTLDPELSRLLQNDDTKYLNDASKADMATMTLLYHTYQFDEPTILSIMKQYRSRPKLDRPDYLSNTLQKIRQTPPTKNKTMPVTRSPQQHTNNNSNGSTATSTTIIQKVNDKQIDLTQILANLKNQFTFKTPEDTSELYVYTKGIYSPAEKMIETILETELQNKLTNHYVNEIMGHLKRDSYVSRDNINHYNGVIPLENGLLNIVTGTLEEYTPDKMFTFKLPLNFNAEADCPQFKKWLSEVQTPENILVLQEYAGYTLLPDMPYHKALFMVGTGGNGKSTFLTTIENIIGHDNTANIDLQDINSDNRFIKANFYGKLANISNEPEIKRWFETPIFKQLTGGDRISAELKNVQKPLKFVNYAKFYFSGNNLPRVRDTSAGFKRRLIIVKWEKSFEGKTQISQVFKRWTDNEEERSGVLNWMLEGLRRLLAAGDFSGGNSQEQAMLEYERSSDSVSAWLKECCTFDQTGRTGREEAYKNYVEYCEDSGLYIVSINPFNNRLRNNPKIITLDTKIAGKKFRCWKGLTIKSTSEEVVKVVEGEQLTLDCKLPQENPQFPLVAPVFSSEKNCNINFSSGSEGGESVKVGETSPVVDHVAVIGDVVPLSVTRELIPFTSNDVSQTPTPQSVKPVETYANNNVNGSGGVGLVDLVYHYFERVPVGEPCRMCENWPVEYVVHMHSKMGRAERLCPSCLKMRRKTFDLAVWVDTTYLNEE